MRKLVNILLLFSFASCLQTDPSLVAPGPQEFLVNIDLHGRNNVFLDLKEKRAPYISPDSTWHLKFQNDKSKWAIFLNPLIDISVHTTSESDFNNIDFTYVVEDLSWNRDVTLPYSIYPALGTWGDYQFDHPKSFKTVYILKVKTKVSLSYFKLQIQDVLDGNYRIRYGKLDGSIDYSYLIKKDQNYLHSYLALGDTPKLVKVEPPKNEWQLSVSFGIDSTNKHKSPALKTLDNFTGIYQLFGTNKSEVKIALEEDLHFDSIDYFYVKRKEYQSYEQYPNNLMDYDPDIRDFRPNGNSIIFKSGTNYYKMKISDSRQTSSTAFVLQLVIQNL